LGEEDSMRKSLKKKKLHLQKRGMQLFKRCLKYIVKQHPKLLKEEVHDVMKGIYDEVYSGSNGIDLAKVLKVYQNHVRYWKEPDQGRRLKQISEKKECIEIKTPKTEKKESDKKIAMKTPKTILESKGMQLFTLLPVKSTFTMLNILIDKTVIQDLILGSKGEILVRPMRGCTRQSGNFSRRTLYP
jgi:hypothetical protein